MMNEKVKISILIKLIIFLIPLLSCSSNKTDNSSVELNEVDIYKSGLSSLANKNYNKATKEFDNLSLIHPFSSLAKKSEIMSAYSLYQNNEIKKSISRTIDDKYINFTLIEKDNKINIFFDIKTLNLIGWQTEDIYQNLVITFISSVSYNQKIDKKKFILPELN